MASEGTANDYWSAEDDAWCQAYNNAAERLFGKVEGDELTAEQDAECIAAADAELEI